METGRPRAINSPEDLWKLFEDYKAWAITNPWLKQDFIKSGEFAGQIVNLQTSRPLTEWEFASFVGLSYQGLRNYGEMKGREEFFDIYSRIKTEMTAQRVSGGLADVYNANLVARIDGIKEQSAVEHSGNIGIADALSKARKRAGLNGSETA